MVNRIWSVYQQAIFAAVASGAGSIVVQARAGCGKTTTALGALTSVPAGKKAAYFAFAKANQQDIVRKIEAEGIPFDTRDVKTLHSHGFHALRYAFGYGLEVEKHKANRLARERFDATNPPKGATGHVTAREASWFVPAVARLVSVAKNTLVSERDTARLAEILANDDIYEPEHAARIVEIAQWVLAECKPSRTRKLTTVDYDDMIWLPVACGIRPFAFDVVFVDECQDLNPTQIELVKMIVKRGGRLIAIGDDRQAIYLFRGADAESMNKIREAFQAKVLPLSITYRCGKKIVEQVKEIVPDYRADDANHDGEIRTAKLPEMVAAAAPGDMILSRSNAPLVRIALRFLAQNRRAGIKGKNLGPRFTEFVDKSKAATPEDLLSYVDAWEGQMVARAEKRAEGLRDASAEIAEIADTAECFRAFAESHKTIAEVKAAIGLLFPDNDRDEDRVTLSTVHRAKGLEAERVYLLADTFAKVAKAARGDEARSLEEANIWYVACTRAKRVLTFVAGDLTAR